MSPRIFPIDECLATSTRILSENRLSYCSASNSRAHRRGILPLAVSCFPAFWFGSQLPLKSRSTLSLSEVTQGLHGAGVQYFRGLLQRPARTTEGRELQSHFRQRCSGSRCATPPADFNRCPTSFRRDHYRPVQLQQLLLRLSKSASSSRCCPCCAGIALYHRPVNETFSPDSNSSDSAPTVHAEKCFPSPLTPRKQDWQNLTLCPIKIACCSESRNANNSWIL